MNIRPFEIALIGIFAIAGVAGLFVLSNFQSDKSEEAMLYGQSVLIWGSLDDKIMNNHLRELTQTNKALEVVKYKEIDPRTFDNELLNAIAEGRSPDLVILPHSLLVTYRTKLQPISYETQSIRSLKDTYIDGTEIFMLSDGLYGIPFAADPLIMYWNRDIFSSSGLAQAPKTWENLMSQTTKAIVRTDDELNITQSAIAFGEYSNVSHAKEIITALLAQAGNSIVEEREGGYAVTVGQNAQNALPAGDAVLSFYTQFAIPNKEMYSWNRSKSLDRTEFLNGSLAPYFGLGSEYPALERENANLNFDVAMIPQDGSATTKRTYADFYAFSIPRASKNIQGAYAVALYLGEAVNAKKLADAYNFAPVHRASFTGDEKDAHRDVVYQSALIARGWLDPSPLESNSIFRKMIEDVTGGKARLKSIILDAVYELESLF